MGFIEKDFSPQFKKVLIKGQGGREQYVFEIKSDTFNQLFGFDATAAGAATGLQLKSAAAGGGFAVSTLSTGANENLSLDSKGTGALILNGTATGLIILGRGTQKTFVEGLSVTTLAGTSQTLTAVSYTHLTLPTNREV